MVALEEKEKKSLIVWEPQMYVQASIVIHPIVIEIFQSEPKWWIKRLATIAIH